MVRGRHAIISTLSMALDRGLTIDEHPIQSQAHGPWPAGPDQLQLEFKISSMTSLFYAMVSMYALIQW